MSSTLGFWALSCELPPSCNAGGKKEERVESMVSRLSSFSWVSGLTVAMRL